MGIGSGSKGSVDQRCYLGSYNTSYATFALGDKYDISSVAQAINTTYRFKIIYDGTNVEFRHDDTVILASTVVNMTGVFYEMYAGGAGASINLLFGGLCKKIILNDLDYHIYAFWFSILNHSDEFLQLIEQTEVSIQNWKDQKRIHNGEPYINHCKRVAGMLARDFPRLASDEVLATAILHDSLEDCPSQAYDQVYPLRIPQFR